MLYISDKSDYKFTIPTLTFYKHEHEYTDDKATDQKKFCIYATENIMRKIQKNFKGIKTRFKTYYFPRIQ